MPRVNIVHAFTLTHSDGKLERFKEGVHEVSDEVASHWYVIAHSDKQGKPVLKPGTPEYAKEAARKNARRKLLDAAVEEAAQEDIDAINEAERTTVRRRIIEDAVKPVQPSNKSFMS